MTGKRITQRKVDSSTFQFQAKDKMAPNDEYDEDDVDEEEEDEESVEEEPAPVAKKRTKKWKVRLDR